MLLLVYVLSSYIYHNAAHITTLVINYKKYFRSTCFDNDGIYVPRVSQGAVPNCAAVCTLSLMSRTQIRTPGSGYLACG
jgi:hypothetical protein